ncbi:MAG TPA: hypothetical protein VGD49_03085 [Longimicrobiales bacterium]
MTLAPAVSFDLGSFRYATHAADVTVTLGLLPAVNSAVVRLPADVPVDAAPGDDAEIRLKCEGDEVTVLKGTLRSIRRHFDHTTAICGDAGVLLAAVRPAATYERQSVADIIRALGGEAGIADFDLNVNLRLTSFSAHQGRTSAQHVATLAELSGAIAYVLGDGVLKVVPRPEEPDTALRYGREFIEYNVTESVAPSQRVTVGFGPAGSTDAPDALKHTVTGLPEDAPAGGPGVLREAIAVLRTPSAAKDASEARSKASSANATRFYARCFLQPALRPGMVVEVQDLPEGLNGGAWLLDRVRHTIASDRAGVTVLSGSIAAPPDGGLFGAIAGAIGALL